MFFVLIDGVVGGRTMCRASHRSSGVSRFGIVMGLTILFTSAPYAIAAPKDTYAKVRESLALVYADLGNGTASVGTAFCIWSTESESYFLTNYHVVEGANSLRLKLEYAELFTWGRVTPQGMETYPYDRRVVTGEVVPRPPSDDADLAVIRVVWRPPLLRAVVSRIVPSKTPDTELADWIAIPDKIPMLTLTGWSTEVGTSIGIAGYPTLVRETAKNLVSASPSGHFGQINGTFGVPPTYIEYDAKTDNGNSGGPLFDTETGVVYGVVELVRPSGSKVNVQNNLAIAGYKVVEWLKNSNIPFEEKEIDPQDPDNQPC